MRVMIIESISPLDITLDISARSRVEISRFWRYHPSLLAEQRCDRKTGAGRQFSSFFWENGGGVGWDGMGWGSVANQASLARNGCLSMLTPTEWATVRLIQQQDINLIAVCRHTALAGFWEPTRSAGESWDCNQVGVGQWCLRATWRQDASRPWPSPRHTQVVNRDHIADL